MLLYSISGELRINKYTPAVTIVAACINADTGVGKNVDFYYIYLGPWPYKAFNMYTNTTEILNNLRHCSDYIFNYTIY